MQQPNQPTEYGTLPAIQRQLERLEERIRQDLEGLRKEVVSRDLLESHLSLLRTQITRLEADRVKDRADLEKRIEEMEKDQASRSERLWIRLGPAIGALAFILTLIEFFSHVRFAP